jgi:hypothetical protein
MHTMSRYDENDERQDEKYPHNIDPQGRAGDEEPFQAPNQDRQHGGDLGRGAGVERNRNQGGFDGKR